MSRTRGSDGRFKHATIGMTRMNRVGSLASYARRSWARALSCALALVVGCGSEVDLGRSVSPPGPLSNEFERAAQTTNLVNVTAGSFSSLAIDGEFLYFTSSRRKLWRCR